MPDEMPKGLTEVQQELWVKGGIDEVLFRGGTIRFLLEDISKLRGKHDDFAKLLVELEVEVDGLIQENERLKGLVALSQKTLEMVGVLLT